MTYLDYQTVISLLEEKDLFYAKPLFIGKYGHAIQYSERFQTTIPKLLGLPEIQGNFAEGIVIKPLQNVLITTKKGDVRPIIKKKIQEFAEKQEYHQAKKRDESYKIAPLEKIEWEMLHLSK